MDQLFHDDARYSFGPIDGSWREFVTIARSMIDPLPLTHHQLGQTAIHIDGDLATTETYLTATHVIPADGASDEAFPRRTGPYEATIAGRYIDRFERRGGHWRIAERIGVIDWRRDLAMPAHDPAAAPAHPDPGAAIPFTVNPSVAA